MNWGENLGRERDSCARGRVTREVRPVSVERLEEPGRAGVDQGVLGVLKQLGGIPPSSLGARGGRRQGEEVGWAGWAIALGAR